MYRYVHKVVLTNFQLRTWIQLPPVSVLVCYLFVNPKVCIRLSYLTAQPNSKKSREQCVANSDQQCRGKTCSLCVK